MQKVNTTAARTATKNVTRTVIGAVMGLVAAAGTVEAQTARWVNPDGGDWGTPANWADQIRPWWDRDAEIFVPGDATVTVTSSADVRDLTLGSETGVLTLDIQTSWFEHYGPLFEIPENVVLTGRGGFNMQYTFPFDASEKIVNRGLIDLLGGLDLSMEALTNYGTILGTTGVSGPLINYGSYFASTYGRFNSVRALENYGYLELGGTLLEMRSDQPLRNHGTMNVAAGSNRVDFAMVNFEDAELLMQPNTRLNVPVLRSGGLLDMGTEATLGVGLLGEFSGLTRITVNPWSPAIGGQTLTFLGPIEIDVEGQYIADGEALGIIRSRVLVLDEELVRVSGRMKHGIELTGKGLEADPFGGTSYVLRFERPCPADFTDNQMGDYSDGIVNGADLSYYVERWLDGRLLADVTSTGEDPGDPRYGVRDVVVNGADLTYFVEHWLAGCP